MADTGNLARLWLLRLSAIPVSDTRITPLPREGDSDTRAVTKQPRVIHQGHPELWNDGYRCGVVLTAGNGTIELAAMPLCEFCGHPILTACDCPRRCPLCEVVHCPSEDCDVDDLLDAALDDID
jgi:hypothetical protein